MLTTYPLVYNGDARKVDRLLEDRTSECLLWKSLETTPSPSFDQSTDIVKLITQAE